MFNKKVNTDGSYRRYSGVTVISIVKNDLKHIETFLKNSVLSEYYSPLPSSSYHMTLFNIWCTQNKFLPPHEEYLKTIKNYSNYRKLCNLDNCNSLDSKMMEMLSGIHWNIKNINFDDFKVKGSLFAGNTLTLKIYECNKNPEITKLRSFCIDITKNDDADLKLHITLGYLYKEVPQEKYEILTNEINKLQKLVKFELELNPPDVYYFKSMTEYIPFDEFYPSF